MSDHREEPQEQDESVTLEVHDSVIGASSELVPDDKSA